MSSKSYQSAVVVIPPETLWAPIQEIRKAHDKAYMRWMPHINLMFPFLENDKLGVNFMEAKKEIGRVFRERNLAPFTVRFTKDSIKYFDHGGKCSVHLRPQQPDRRDSLGKVNGKRLRKTRWNPVEVDAPSVTKTTPSPRRPPVTRAAFGIVQVLPDPPVPSEFRSLPTPSLSSLRDAVWTEGCVAAERTRATAAGIDALRDAYWVPGNPTEASRQVEQQSANVEVLRSVQVCVEDRERSPERCVGVPMEESMRQTNKKEAHSALVNLQSTLEDVYPQFSEQSTKSDQGFQPHLTLGQCAKHQVERFVNSLKQNWVDVEFEVNEIHLISCQGPKHEIYQTVKFG